jgi:hypothetical protein
VSFLTNCTLTGYGILRRIQWRYRWTYVRQRRRFAVRFDTKDVWRYKVPTVTTDPLMLSNVIAELSLRQLPCGGWAALASSSQPAIEPTCYAILALSSVPAGDIQRGQDFLLRTQNPDGSWPVILGDDQGGAYVTSLAAIALHDLVTAIPARLRAIHWLLNLAGKESNWFWRWKFRTADRHVRFDPDKYGWPWFPDTISWVVPTAFAILALNQIPCSCDGFEDIPLRVDCGIQMLFDRACPGGGWNAGNGVVYGFPMAPHIDDTAIALLALRDWDQHPVVQSAVHYLEAAAPTLAAPWSLGWASLALAAHRRSNRQLAGSLPGLSDLSGTEDTGTLAVASLALDHTRGLSALGVVQ